MKILRRGKEMYVSSEEETGTLYRVRKSQTLRRLTCSCPDFRYRRLNTDEDCKHIKEYKIQLCAVAML